MIKESFMATQHPEFIRKMGAVFINEFLGGVGNFIGIHFRFNTGDFFGADFAKNAEDEATGNHIPNQIAKHIHRSMLNGTYFLDKVVDYIEKKVENGEFEKKP